MTTTGIPDWEWTVLGNEDGNLHSPVGGRGWFAPAEIEIRGDRLIYAPAADRPQSSRRVSSRPGILAEFLQLAEAEPEQIGSFADETGF